MSLPGNNGSKPDFLISSKILLKLLHPQPENRSKHFINKANALFIEAEQIDTKLAELKLSDDKKQLLQDREQKTADAEFYFIKSLQYEEKPESFLGLAKISLRRSNPKQALQILQDAIQRLTPSPQTLKLLTLQAHIFFNLGCYSETIQLITQIKKNYKITVDLITYQGYSQLYLGKFPEALEVFLQIKHTTGARFACGFIRLFLAKPDLDNAKKNFNEVITKFHEKQKSKKTTPDKPSLLVTLSKIGLLLVTSLKAKLDFEGLLKKNPKLPIEDELSFLLVGIALRITNNYIGSINYFAQGLKLFPMSPHLRMQYGIGCFLIAKYDSTYYPTSLKIFNEAAAYYPLHDLALHYLTRIHLLTGQLNPENYEKAFEIFSNLLEKSPRHPAALENTGELYLHEALRIPTTLTKDEFLSLDEKAEVSLLESRLSLRLEALQISLHYFPKNEVTLQQLITDAKKYIKVLLQLENYAEAYKVAQQILLRYEPDTKGNKLIIAEILHRHANNLTEQKSEMKNADLEQNEKSLKRPYSLLKRALRYNPKNTKIISSLQEVLFKLGRFYVQPMFIENNGSIVKIPESKLAQHALEKAKDAFQEFLEFTPDHLVAKAYLKKIRTYIQDPFPLKMKIFLFEPGEKKPSSIGLQTEAPSLNTHPASFQSPGLNPLKRDVRLEPFNLSTYSPPASDCDLPGLIPDNPVTGYSPTEQASPNSTVRIQVSTVFSSLLRSNAQQGEHKKTDGPNESTPETVQTDYTTVNATSNQVVILGPAIAPQPKRNCRLG